MAESAPTSPAGCRLTGSSPFISSTSSSRFTSCRLGGRVFICLFVLPYLVGGRQQEPSLHKGGGIEVLMYQGYIYRAKTSAAYRPGVTSPKSFHWTPGRPMGSVFGVFADSFYETENQQSFLGPDQISKSSKIRKSQKKRIVARCFWQFAILIFLFAENSQRTRNDEHVVGT
jgi:hypothetical protein